MTLQRYAGGKPRTDAVCALCGIVAGNSLGIHVIRHSLQRTVYRDGRTIAVRVGTIAVCDQCIREHARPPRRLRGIAAKAGYRS